MPVPDDNPPGWGALFRSLLLGGVPRGPAVEELPEIEPEPLEPSVGDVLGNRYRVGDRIGSGAAGAVFRAHDQVLDLEVAIKVLVFDGPPGEEATFRETLRAEARAALRLTHPNIVRVHTWGQDERWEYLVMEHVDGPDLHKWRLQFPEHRAPVPQVLRIGVALADALAYAHAHGVVHNDVKPGNVVVAPDGPKICDFGLARLSHRAATRAQAMGGSPVYMAPERLRGEEGDGRSDQYSLAASLFTLVAGHAPFGRVESQAIEGHISAPLPADDHVPAAFDRLLRTAMAKDPEARFATLGAFRDALLAQFAAWEAETRAAPIETGSGTPVMVERDRATLRLAAPPPPPPPPARRPPARPAPALHPPPGMVLVSERRVARPDGEEVGVGPFWCDVHPVTAARYREFLERTGHTPPAHWFGTRPRPGREAHPVVGVTLDDARAYARWAGRRLPTESEWMSLLRGPNGDAPFPWGRDCGKGATCVCPIASATGTSPVGVRPASASKDGVQDLLGNVWEWVDPEPRWPAVADGVAVALGASFRHGCREPGKVPRTELSATKAYEYLGFRCVADLGAS